MTAEYQAFNSVTVWLPIIVFLFHIDVVWNAGSFIYWAILQASMYFSIFLSR